MSIVSPESIKAIGGMVAQDITDDVADALGADVEYRLREIVHVIVQRIISNDTRRQ